MQPSGLRPLQEDHLERVRRPRRSGCRRRSSRRSRFISRCTLAAPGAPSSSCNARRNQGDFRALLRVPRRGLPPREHARPGPSTAQASPVPCAAQAPQSPECRLPPCQADVRRFRHPAIQIPRWTIVSTGSTVRVLIRHPVSFPVHVPCRLAADRRKHRVDQRPPLPSPRRESRGPSEPLAIADSEACIWWPRWRHQLKSRWCRQQDKRTRGMRYRRIAVYASNSRWRLPFFLFPGGGFVATVS